MTFSPTSSRSGGAGSGSVFTNVIKTSDESVASNTTPQTDDQLLFVTTNLVVYSIEMEIVYGSPAGAGTPDIKMVFGEDATDRGVMLGTGYSNTETFFAPGAPANRTTTMVFGTAAADRIVRITGAIIGGGGTFALQWAQNASGVNPTIVRAGSVLRYQALQS